MERSKDAIALSERWGDVMTAKAEELQSFVAAGPGCLDSGTVEWTERIVLLANEIAQIAETIQLLDAVVNYLRCPRCGYEMGGRS
jgi:hypothetical protein